MSENETTETVVGFSVAVMYRQVGALPPEHKVQVCHYYEDGSYGIVQDLEYTSADTAKLVADGFRYQLAVLERLYEYDPQ